MLKAAVVMNSDMVMMCLKNETTSVLRDVSYGVTFMVCWGSFA